MDTIAPRWLLLIHQIPPKPAYLRVKVGRKLLSIGAVALKNSVYVLPRADEALEDLQWVRGEVVAGGGEATIVEAAFIDGLKDIDVEEFFRAARDHDYAALESDVRALGKRVRARPSEAARRDAAPLLARLGARLDEIAAIDFFGASRRETVDGLLRELCERLTPPASAPPATTGRRAESYRGRTWVTRTGVRVDRIASAWLIKRFVDADARFKFVPAKGYRPEEGELRFDMFEAEFGHEGDLCTFEVLCSRMRLVEPGLDEVAKVVHDIDLKDDKYRLPETAGIAGLIAGLCATHSEDEARLEHGSRLFEQLLAHYAASKAKRP